MIRLTVFFEVNISWVVGRDLKGQNDSAEALNKNVEKLIHLFISIALPIEKGTK